MPGVWHTRGTHRRCDAPGGPDLPPCPGYRTPYIGFGEVQPDLNVDPGFAPPAHPRVELVPSAQGIRAFEISFITALPYNP